MLQVVRTATTCGRWPSRRGRIIVAPSSANSRTRRVTGQIASWRWNESRLLKNMFDARVSKSLFKSAPLVDFKSNGVERDGVLRDHGQHGFVRGGAKNMLIRETAKLGVTSGERGVDHGI